MPVKVPSHWLVWPVSSAAPGRGTASIGSCRRPVQTALQVKTLTSCQRLIPQGGAPLPVIRVHQSSPVEPSL